MCNTNQKAPRHDGASIIIVDDPDGMAVKRVRSARGRTILGWAVVRIGTAYDETQARYSVHDMDSPISDRATAEATADRLNSAVRHLDHGEYCVQYIAAPGVVADPPTRQRDVIYLTPELIAAELSGQRSTHGTRKS